MSDERWNDDIAYAFSTHRTWLRRFGLWPFKKLTIFTRIQQFFVLFVMFTVLPFTMMDFWIHTDANGSLESILYTVGATIGSVKFISILINRNKIYINLNAAIDDWLLAKNDENIWKIMRKYAFRSRILTISLLYSGVGCYFVYIFGVVFINLQQKFFTDPSLTNDNFTITNWVLLIPSGPLGNLITSTQFIIIVTLQNFQLGMMCVIQPVMDSFIFNLITHLAGQLEVIKTQFQIFANEPDTVVNHRKKFVNLINRHGELMEYYQNLEGSFHILMLAQIVVTTLMLSILGLRMNICLNENNYIEASKSMLVLNYLLIQSLLYTYSGDFMQRESEGILIALYKTSWLTFPVVLKKDLYFAMMRASIPFRLTGGKFFYINRETMINMFRTAASYFSVLRIALLKK